MGLIVAMMEKKIMTLTVYLIVLKFLEQKREYQ
jgi:hypothetical protein